MSRGAKATMTALLDLEKEIQRVGGGFVRPSD
jgi:hypothetical protein